MWLHPDDDSQVDAAVEAPRRAGQPARKTFAIGFQTGHEMNWLPRAMHVLRDEQTPLAEQTQRRGVARTRPSNIQVETAYHPLRLNVDHRRVLLMMFARHNWPALF